MIKMRFLPYVLPLLAFMLGGIGAVSAQSAGNMETIENGQWVLSSAGGSETVLIGGKVLGCDWNIGEPITETFGSRYPTADDPGFDASKKRLTQGFEQGEGFIEDPYESDLANQDREEMPAVKVYPNPVRDFLHIVLPECDGAYTLCLRGLQGGVLYTRREATAGGYGLDMKRLSAGIYVLEVEMEQSRQWFKIVKVE